MMKKLSTKLIALLGIISGSTLTALPSAVFASTCTASPIQCTEEATVTVTVDQVISLSGETPVSSIAMSPENTNTTMTTTLKATTNSTTGYNIIAESGSATTGTTLKNGDSTVPSYTATSGTALSGSTAGWGLSIAKPSGKNSYTSSFPLTSDSKYLGLGVAGYNTVIKSTALTTGVENEATVVTYGISIGPNPVAGDYVGTVKYTIAANTN